MHLILKISVMIVNKKNPHFDIYDLRNCENLDNTSTDILVKKGPTKKMNLNFPIYK